MLALVSVTPLPFVLETSGHLHPRCPQAPTAWLQGFETFHYPSVSFYLSGEKNKKVFTDS